MAARLTDPTARKPRRRPHVAARAANAELLVLALATGVVRPEPLTKELAFNGLRYGFSDRDIDRTIGAMGVGRVADAVGRAIAGVRQDTPPPPSRPAPANLLINEATQQPRSKP